MAATLSNHPYLYFYLYWLSFPIEYALTFLIIVQVFAHIFRAHIQPLGAILLGQSATRPALKDAASRGAAA